MKPRIKLIKRGRGFLPQLFSGQYFFVDNLSNWIVYKGAAGFPERVERFIQDKRKDDPFFNSSKIIKYEDSQF